MESPAGNGNIPGGPDRDRREIFKKLTNFLKKIDQLFYFGEKKIEKIFKKFLTRGPFSFFCLGILGERGMPPWLGA